MENKLSQTKIKELSTIIAEEFGIIMNPSDTERFAYSLLGYFKLLIKLMTKT